MRAVGIGLKAGLQIAASRTSGGLKAEGVVTMYRVCWHPHRNYTPKSYHFFSIRYKPTGVVQQIRDEDLLCPKCGRMSKAAPRWVRQQVARGITEGLKVGARLYG